MAYPSSPQNGPRDSVDRLLEGWAHARPDLDFSPVAVIARLDRARRIIDTELEATFAEHGLNGSDFGVLVTLRRLDQPNGISQRQLMNELNLTSGTISVRVERLSERGLVSRSSDPHDGRNSLVALTDTGRALFDQVAPAHLATESRLLTALDADQLEAFTSILRDLLISLEGSTSDDTFPRLGLTLAPAHVTLEIRRSVGLPQVLGLLVRDVAADSRAQRANINTGDVLVRANDHELRSITALYAAVKNTRSSGQVTITLVRGIDTELDVALDLSPDRADEHAPGKTISTSRATTHAI